jgi:hypothetical protein
MFDPHTVADAPVRRVLAPIAFALAFAFGAPAVASNSFFAVVPISGVNGQGQMRPVKIALAGAVPLAAHVGEPYEFNLGALLSLDGPEGTEPGKVSWSVVSGDLPAGLSLVGDRVVGTPTELAPSRQVVIQAEYVSAQGTVGAMASYSFEVPVVALADMGSYRAWADGTYASSCEGYIRSGSLSYPYQGAVGDGVYRLNQNGTAKDVYCDMTRDGGGWVLLANYSRNSTGAPNFYTAGNLAVALSPNSRAGTPSGAIGFSQLPALPVSRARFDFIAGDDPNQIAYFFKTATRANVNAWFKPGAREPDATVTCTNYAMTSQCTTKPFDHDYSLIRPGETAGSTQVFWGVELTKYGFARNPSPIAVHGVGTGWCSNTGNLNGNAWHDSASEHWGNGMRIWVR